MLVNSPPLLKVIRHLILLFLLVSPSLILGQSPASIRPLRSILQPPQDNNSAAKNFSRHSVIANESIITGHQVVAASDYTFPIEDCFTYTYKLTVGNESFVKETFTTRGGITYIVGYAIVGGEYRGMLQQLNMTGDIAWTKTFSFPGTTLLLNNIRQLPSGNLIMIGTKDFLNNGVKVPVILTTDIDGNIITSRTIDLAGFDGMYVSPSGIAGLGIGFVIQHEYTIAYGKLDDNGYITWFRSTPALGNGTVTGLVRYDYNRWYIAYTGDEAGKKTGIIAGINQDNGNIDWGLKFGGSSSTQEFIFHDLEIINLRPRICGIYTSNSGPYQLFKATINPGGTLEQLQTFSFTGINFNNTARSAISPWGEVITFSQSDNDNDIYAFKTINESYPENLIAWSKKFPAIGKHVLVNVERMFDGGYIIASNKLTDNKELFLKTDSLGMIKDCAPTDFTATSIVANPVFPSISISCPPEISSMTNVSVNIANVALLSTYDCKSLSCPIRPPEDPCLESFARRYRSSSYCDLGTSIVTDDNGKITVAGITRDNPYNADNERSFIAQMDNAGKLLNRKMITLGNGTNISSLLRSRDGGTIALGSSSYPYSVGSNDTTWLSVTKFDANLQLVWNKSWPIYGISSSLYGMVESNDGSLFINYSQTTAFCKNTSILKLNADGSMNWLKNYQGSALCFSGYYGSITQDDDFVYFINQSSSEMVLFKIDKNSGNAAWSRAYSFSWINNNIIGLNISIMDNSIVFHGKDSYTSTPRDIIVTVDKNGTLKKVKSFASPLSTVMSSMVITKNNELVMVGTNYSSGTFYRLDSDLNILYSKQVSLPGSPRSNIYEGAGGNIYELTGLFNSNAYLTDFAVKKYSFNGLLGSCSSDTLILTQETPVANQRNISPAVTNGTTVLQSLPYQEFGYSLQENQLMCSALTNCTSIILEDIPDICNTDPFIVKANKNAGCEAMVNFEYDNAVLELIERTTSTVTLRAKESGVHTVKVKLFTGCIWMEDKKSFNASVINQTLSLENDTVLCSGSIKLNAGKGFLSYLWSDGSTDSTLTVSQSGKYYVDVTTGCSDSQTDTINIVVAAVPQLNLGADTSFCKGDSVIVNAGNDFAQYAWNNGSTLPIIILKNKGKYSVIGYTVEGCKVSDTVEVLNNWDKPVISLAHKSFLCYDSSITLFAGNHNTYLWQDGSIINNYTVTKPGKYYVSVSNIYGCTASDTVVVSDVLPLPAAFLPADDFVCNNGELQLSPSRSYNKYKWSSGQNSRDIIIKSSGEYWLEVTDENGCVGRDSIQIFTKECLKGIYMPTAFTPNNDGKNDILRPYIGGNIRYYQLNIFDRWGHLVFTTNDIKKGWNGEVKGIPQDTNGFAWTCVYQLENGEMKKETGMTMLVR